MRSRRARIMIGATIVWFYAIVFVMMVKLVFAAIIHEVEHYPTQETVWQSLSNKPKNTSPTW